MYSAVESEGKLNGFYRGMQMQGHIVAQGLMEIPEYLEADDIDVRYVKKPGFFREIPFVDTFTINRFLGGYPQMWIKGVGRWDEKLGMASMDYAIRQPDGSLAYRKELIALRLEPFLKAGYRLKDITIGIENIPWALARDGGMADEGGAEEYGQSNPPADMAQWAEMMTQFCEDLKASYPSEVGPNFKIGNEFDTKRSFNGSAADFYAYYLSSYRVLRDHFPESQIVPGEFTADGTKTDDESNRVYDTQDLLKVATAAGMAPNYTPRSLHAFLDWQNPLPSNVINRAVKSYTRLPNTAAEIHQFGLLDQPWGSLSQFGQWGHDCGSRQAVWSFQVLMGLKKTLNPSRVFHWDAFEMAHTKSPILNGKGFLMLFLDRYRGATMHRLQIQSSSAPAETEIMAVGFQRSKGSAIILANFSVALGESGTENVILPDDSLLPKGEDLSEWKFISYNNEDGVFPLIRKDMEAAGNLRPEFVENPTAVAAPLDMAYDRTAVRLMISKNWPKYVANMKANLRWHPFTQRESVNTGPEGMRLQLRANELLILERGN